ncbi:DUF6301 family protein [Nocardia heshunensis]
MMKVPVRVDVASAVEIARAAAGFEWTWSQADSVRFATAVGWGEPVALEGFPEVSLVAHTPVNVWDSSAIFSHPEGELRQVHVLVSDCPRPDDHRTPELLDAAAEKVAASLIEIFGAPTTGPVGSDHGMVWDSDTVVIGLVTVRRMVELVLVHPVWQRWWEDRHRQRVARRAELTEWDRFAESLADCLTDMYEDCPVVLHVRDGRDVRIFKNPPGGARILEDTEAFYVEIGTPDPDDPEWEFDADTDFEDPVYESADYPEPLDTPGYSRLAVRITSELKAMGAGSPHDVIAHDWVTDPGPTEIIPLRPADDLPPRSRQPEPREVPEIQLDHEWRGEHTELDMPGALGVVRAASSFDWTWHAGDVKRFAAHAGWRIYTDRTIENMYWSGTGLDVHSPQAIFELAGDVLTVIDVAISTDLGDNDLEDEGYDFLNHDLDQAYAVALNSFRAAFGEPRHGTSDDMYLFWEFGDFTIAPVRSYSLVNLRIRSAARRDRNRPAIRAAALEITSAPWQQLAEDVAASAAAGIPTGSGLVVGGGDTGFVRFIARLGTLQAELGAPDLADERWLSTNRVSDHWGWTGPDESSPYWRLHLQQPELFRDYLSFAEQALTPLRNGRTLAPRNLKPRLEEVN